MFFLPIENTQNDRYKRVKTPSGKLLIITQEFLNTNGLENSKLEDIENFIDEALAETPIGDLDPEIILDYKENA